tara:strand:+ start:895 stop:1320 length:426 start_codon:yes stop_codon:yes gene_type:complete
MKNKKTTNIKTTIRKIVREEVAMAINEVITELKKPTMSPIPQQRQITEAVGKEVNFTNNSILNEVLNETAQDGEWKTLGGKEFTTERMSELVGGQYADMMNDTNSSNVNVVVDGQTADFLKKDYRDILKRTEEKQQQKYGK